MSFTRVIERRFRHLFRFYDVKKDGRISSKYHHGLTQKLTDLFKTDATDKVRKEADKWWSKMEPFGVNNGLTEDEHMNIIRFLYQKDFAMIRKHGFKLYEAIFDMIDHNKDNKISLEELIKYYACFNVTDSDRVKKIFQKLDLDKDGFVTRDEWVIARLYYAMREDPDYDYGFMIDSSCPVPENSSSGKLTSNLLKRYKMAFRFYDINKDGFHALSDYVLVLDNVCNLHNGGEEQRVASVSRGQRWWKDAGRMAVDGKITEERFVYQTITNLVTDFQQMRLKIILAYRPWFHVADHNGDGLISEDEFLKFYAACNVKDAGTVKKIFEQVDLDDDGFVSEEEWILANLDYWTTDDPNFDHGFLYDVE